MRSFPCSADRQPAAVPPAPESAPCVRSFRISVAFATSPRLSMIVAFRTVNSFYGAYMTKVDLLRFIPFRLNRLAAEVSRELAGVYSDEFGIDITEWRVLATLGMSEPRSAGFIVRCTRTHKSKISRAVTRLALAGMIEGAPSSDDRRETQLRMTP